MAITCIIFNRLQLGRFSSAVLVRTRNLANNNPVFTFCELARIMFSAACSKSESDLYKACSFLFDR